MPDEPKPDQDAAILKKLYAEDPEIREMIQRRVKKDNPNAVFPELDAKDSVAKVAETFGAKLDKTAESIERTNLELARTKKHAKWREMGLDPEAIEKTIEKYGLTGSKDMPVEQAALQILEAESATAEGSRLNVREQGRARLPEDWAKIANKPDQVINNFAQDLAHKAVDEIIQANRAAQRGFQPTGFRR